MLNLYPTQMSLWAVPLASPGHTPVTDADLLMIDTSGRKCLDLFEWAGRDASLLRMLLQQYRGALWMKYAWIWKLRATPQSRYCYQLAPLVQHTTEIVSLLWPTPTASDNRVRQPPSRPYITKNGTLRHINKNGGQTYVRTSQAVRYWDGAGYENPDWKELLMGLPPGWTDLSRATSLDGLRFRAKHRKTLNRRASNQLQALKTKGVLQRSETRLYGSKYCRLHKRLEAGYRRKMSRI